MEWVKTGHCSEVISVIRSTLTKRGKGIEGDPVRIITQYFSMDGELLFEKDPWIDEQKNKSTIEPYLDSLFAHGRDGRGEIK